MTFPRDVVFRPFRAVGDVVVGHTPATDAQVQQAIAAMTPACLADYTCWMKQCALAGGNWDVDLVAADGSRAVSCSSQMPATEPNSPTQINTWCAAIPGAVSQNGFLNTGSICSYTIPAAGPAGTPNCLAANATGCTGGGGKWDSSKNTCTTAGGVFTYTVTQDPTTGQCTTGPMTRAAAPTPAPTVTSTSGVGATAAVLGLGAVGAALYLAWKNKLL